MRSLYRLSCCCCCREFLEPYQQANSTIDTAFEELTSLILDNLSQQKRLSQIKLQQTAWNRLILQAIWQPHSLFPSNCGIYSRRFRNCHRGN
ncbi:MAG: CHASE3 domain-containing protein [Desmonostoc vinosum HA7617-LM4]|nr:CHASE3 domain-containing protein [Desmonostoc vinosum HA7617-LM4]